MTESKENNPSPYFARQATGLVRTVGPWTAFVTNLVTMSTVSPFVLAFFTALLFVGVDLPLTILFILVPGTIITLIYYLFGQSMPRTGGDYVWISRVIHPSIGVMGNAFVTIDLIIFLGSFIVWIPYYVLSPMFAALGVIYSSPSMTALATTFATATPASVAISLIINAIFIIPLFLGTKGTFRAVWIAFAISLIGSLVIVFAFLSAPVSAFTANFNTLSGMEYAKTIAVASLPKGFTASATLLGSFYAVFSFIGFNYSSYYSGEIRNVKRSQIIAMLGSLFAFAGFMALVFAAAYYSMGSNFFSAVSFLSGTGNAYYSMASPPVLNFLVVFADPNPVIIVISAIGLIAAIGAVIIGCLFVIVRNLFAWSFDRLIPVWFTKLGTRWSSAWPALIVAAVLETIFAILTFYVSSISEFVLYDVISFLTAWFIVSVAAILFPFRRKDIFNLSPEVVKKKIGRIPLITILGVLGAIFMAFLIYAGVSPAITAPPTGPILVKSLAYLYVPLMGITGLIIYAIAQYYRKRQGIELSLTFKEIPPE